MPPRGQKGGTFLCSDSYCLRYGPNACYRCSADTGMVHGGFRGVTTRQLWEQHLKASK
jgi:hypothetical protein